MKNNIINGFLSVLFLLSAVLFTSCNEDTPGKYQMTEGLPKVYFIRYQDKDLEEQLLTGATMNDNIVIIGENLTSVQQVLFNNVPATLNINFITKNTLFVNVPGTLPSVVTDKIYFVNAKLDTFAYDFKVIVAAPTFARMKCEWVPEGRDVVVYGNSFFATEASNLKVFVGNYQIPTENIISYERTKLVFKAPPADISGPVEIRTLFGTTGPRDIFRDTRGMFGSFEEGFVPGWGRPTHIENDPLLSINGNYVRLEGNIAAGEWVSGGNDMTINIWGEDNGVPTGNLFPSDPATSTLKLEVNVLEPWNAVPMIFTFYAQGGQEGYLWNDGNSAGGGQPRGVWVPWLGSGSYTGDGWETISIPLSRMNLNGYGVEVPLSTAFGGFGLSIHNRGSAAWAGAAGNECRPRILVDNIRVIP